MAQNSTRQLIDHLKFLSGQDSLTDAQAATLLNYGIDSYTQLAITTDGKAQVDDAEEDDVSRATATLSSGSNKVNIGADFISWSFVEIEDADGNKTRLTPYDLRYSEETTPSSTVTSKPSRYDYYGGVFYFDTYADQAYTIRALYSRAFTHLDADTPSQVLGIPSIHAEYPVMHALYRLSLRTADEHRSQVRNELVDMERKIADFYRERDEDTPKRLIAKMDIRK